MGFDRELDSLQLTSSITRIISALEAPLSDAFRLWLESKECLDLLLICSDQVISRARKKTINLELIFQDALTDGLGGLSHVVANEMWTFLKEKSHRVAERASDKLVRGDTSGFMEVLIGVFLDNCKDKRRTFTVDPVYAYYRSIRETLTQSAIVNTPPGTGRGTFYSFSFDESLQKLPTLYWNQSYSDWPQPPQTESEIYDSPAIIELARFFWIETLDRFTAAYLLPIKELSRFLNSKYSIDCEIQSESNSPLSNTDDEGNSRTIDDITVTAGHAEVALGLTSRQNPRLEMDIINAELELLARDCLETLTEAERVVLHRTESGAKMIDIAHELNMKSASNVSPYKDKAFAKVKRIWSLWGTESFEKFTDDDKEDFWIFYDKVILFCKTADQCRKG